MIHTNVLPESSQIITKTTNTHKHNEGYNNISADTRIIRIMANAREVSVAVTN